MPGSDNMIRAHFDGEHIVLDEPIELERDARLFISVVDNLSIEDAERKSWLKATSENLESAYDGDADDYPLELVKEFNPDYERG